MTRTYTATERKDASRQALALLTASQCDDLPETTIEELIDGQGANLPIVTASLVGLASGLLLSFEDRQEGAAKHWLAWVGARLEAMPEDGA